MKASPARPAVRIISVPVAPRAAQPRHTGRATRPPVAAGATTMCERCGAVYERKTWRAGERTRKANLVGIGWTLCPACAGMEEGEYFGRLRVLAPLDPELESAVRRRIWNVESRARHTQPERRVVRIERLPAGLEILTTSNKLAHRVARELEKAFGGRARYRWSGDEGSLDATWTPPLPTAAMASARVRRPRIKRRTMT